MKKVSGWISVRALGSYDFEFYVDNDATDEEIEKMVDDKIEMSIHYEVEAGYKRRMVEEFYKD